MGSATLCSSLLSVDLLRHPPAVSNRMIFVCIYPSNKHNCEHKIVAIRICPADVLNVAVLGVSVSLSDDGRVLFIGDTGLSTGRDSYASVVAEVGTVAAVIVTDVFINTVSCCTGVREVDATMFDTHFSKSGCWFAKY